MEKELERMRLLAIKNFFVEAGITYEDVITEYQVEDLHDVGVSTRLLVEIQSLKENWDLL
jgi:hypothetical protein